MFEKKSENKKTNFNDFFLKHIFCLKSSKMKFYRNPTTDFVTRLPYIALGNLPKIRKILTYSSGLDHILDYTRGARWPFRAFCVDGPQITSY